MWSSSVVGKRGGSHCKTHVCEFQVAVQSQLCKPELLAVTNAISSSQLVLWFHIGLLIALIKLYMYSHSGLWLLGGTFVFCRIRSFAFTFPLSLHQFWKKVKMLLKPVEGLNPFASSFNCFVEDG